MAKDSDIRIRFSGEDKELIVRAVKQVHSELDVSKWARGVLKAEALRVLGLTLLDPEDTSSTGSDMSVVVPLTPKQQEKAKALVETKPSDTLTAKGIVDATESIMSKLPDSDEVNPKDKIDDLKKNLGLKTGAEIPTPEKPAESVYEAFEKFTLDKEEPYFEEHPSPMEFEATARISKVKILDTNKYLNSGGLVRFNYKGETYEMNISEDVYVALVKDSGVWMKIIGQGNTWNAKGSITVTKK